MKTSKTSKIMGETYKKICSDLLNVANSRDLPVSFELTEVDNIPCHDVGWFINQLEKDTGLYVYATIYNCHDCGKTHIHIDIDYPDVDETKLQ